MSIVVLVMLRLVKEMLVLTIGSSTREHPLSRPFAEMRISMSPFRADSLVAEAVGTNRKVLSVYRILHNGLWSLAQRLDSSG